jgi:hypothetical protein
MQRKDREMNLNGLYPSLGVPGEESVEVIELLSRVLEGAIAHSSSLS